MPSLVAYARTSTDEQDLGVQVETLQRAAAIRQVKLDWSVFEVASGRGTLVKLDELEWDARRGRVSQLWVVSLDRLGRSTLEVLMRLDRLARAGCAVVSLREALDFSTPAGRLQVQLLAAFAEFEATMIASRTKEALRVARARGRRLGRPPVKFDVERARALRAVGYSWRTIALDVGASEGTVRRYCRATIPPAMEASPSAS